MKKKKLLRVVLFISIIVIVSVITVPFVAREIYKKNKSDKNLLSLCKIACMYNNSDWILEYVPLLDSDVENIDEYMAILLEKSIDCEFDIFAANVKKAYLSFSCFENACGQCSNAINVRYDSEKDKENAVEVYDALFDISPNPEYRYFIFQQKGSFLHFVTGDYQYLENTREKRYELWDAYEQWAEEGNIR